MRPTVIEEKDKTYDTMAEAVLFETQENAQAILDERFPGHTITVSAGDNQYAEIKNQFDEIVVRMSC